MVRRNRVLSFMSQWSLHLKDDRGSATSSPSPAPAPSAAAAPVPLSATTASSSSSLPVGGDSTHRKPEPISTNISSSQIIHESPSSLSPPPLASESQKHLPGRDSKFSSPVTASPVQAADYASSPVSIDSPSPSSPSHAARARSSSRSNNSRPASMVQTYQPHVMDVGEDTIPELLPIFTLLNSHANKLYQEGYFLKLDDQNAQGKPNADRTWTECFAQLVGTVLSLWDAADLDAAGEDGEVLPKFINLTDASIKMIESLPTRTNEEQPLQNILSISTAGRNRYLLHFNSHHSLIQWTSGIRLAMFEHSTLQEAYTGALIAGKGKTVNNIGVIMERSRIKTEAWVRVRFGAGVPWRRCWCVITPPDEKEYQKLQKEMKKKSPYDRSHVPHLKGDVKFYESKKEADKKKKARPIASITDAYAAYAIYPQALALVDKSTLLKVEGNITIHSDPPSATEGFVFIMPETHPMVTGFEMLLRFLFPTWDTFGLYGRPGRLVASALDQRSLMFAMPKHKRYGYLELLDVSNLILENGSVDWQERVWRKKMKEVTGKRMTAMEDGSRSVSRSGSRSSKRLSFGPANGTTGRPRVNFADDSGSARSSRSFSISDSRQRTDSAPPDSNRKPLPFAMGGDPRHSRNISDTQLAQGFATNGFDSPGGMNQSISMRSTDRTKTFPTNLAATPERVSSEDERPLGGTPPPAPEHDLATQRLVTPEPVNAPPAFSHGAGARPTTKLYHSPELRRANSRLSSTTLSQLANANGMGPETFPDDSSARHSAEESAGSLHGQNDPRGLSVQPHANPVGSSANSTGFREAVRSPNHHQFDPSRPPQESLPRLPAHDMPRSPGGPGGTRMGPGVAVGQGANFRQGPRSNGPYSPQGPPPPYMMGPPNGKPGSRGPPPSMIPGFRGPPGPGPYSPALYSPRDGHPGSNHSQSHGSSGGSPHGSGPSSPISRKPLPHRAESLQRRGIEPGQGPPSPASSGSFTSQGYPSEFLAYQRRPPGQDLQLTRQISGRSEASNLDTASTSSPDYASSVSQSFELDRSERPRAGVLKTVGNQGESPAVTPTATSDKKFALDIPSVDFGPTINYGAMGAPKTKGPNPLPATNTAPSETGHSPLQTPNETAGTRPPHIRQESSERRTMAWQPGLRAGSPGPERALSPEEFVHHRAAAASAPMFAHAHQRSMSGNTLAAMRNETPTPPLRRPGSQDLPSLMGGPGPAASHARKSSTDLLSRLRTPSSAIALSAGETSSYLSAYEQTQIARATGTPLVSMATSAKPQGQGNGLVGAIENRERERAQARAGIANQAVTQAIDQRQREQNQAQRAAQYAYQQQQQAQMAGMHMSMMGSPPPPHAPFAAQGPRSMSPGPGMMAPGMGPRSMSPDPGMMSPGMGSGMGPQRSMSPGPGMMLPGMAPQRNMSHGPGMMHPGVAPGMGPQRSMSPGPGMMAPGMGPGMGPQRSMSPGPGMMVPRSQSPGPRMMGGMGGMGYPGSPGGPLQRKASGPFSPASPGFPHPGQGQFGGPQRPVRNPGSPMLYHGQAM